MQKRISPVVAIIILVAAVLTGGIFAAVHRGDRLVPAAVALSGVQVSTSTTAVAATSSASSATTVHAPSKAPVKNANAKQSPVAASSTQKPEVIQVIAPLESASAPAAARSQSNLPLCTANELTGIASWQESAGGSIAGTLRVTNSSRIDCSLSHDAYLQIISGTEALPIARSANADAGSYTDLIAGGSVPLRFVWQNWCGGSSPEAKSVRLILPANGGYLKVPLIDQGGRQQTDVPRCDAPSARSTVTSWQ